MGATSNAVQDSFLSRVLGYNLTTGNFNTTTPNLPQRIALLGEVNEANQATFDPLPYEIVSATEAGNRYGFGSPIYNAARILLPLFGGGVAGIPVIVYPQAKAGGSAAKVLTVTPTGTATANGTHTIVLNGRRNLDGVAFDVNIVTGDTPTAIVTKITDAINAVLGASVIGTKPVPTVATFTSKWFGLTSDEINITIDNNGNTLGVTYAVLSTTSGSGTPSIVSALTSFGNEWNTIALNSYGTVPSIMDAFEFFNGNPNNSPATGRYTGIVFKPLIAITGSTLADPSNITDARLNELTIAIAPAPLSKGLSLEAAANMSVLFANVAQNTPELDVAGKNYPDMPTPVSIGAMSDYASRDLFLKKGCSTVDLISGQYVVQDFVTTYHKLGENPPQFRYPRNLNIDFNVKFGIRLLEELNVIDHVIAADNDTVTSQKVVKPKMWVQVLNSYADQLVLRGLLVQADFMKASILVNLSTSNPDRLETFFKYKRSGSARIVSTTAQAGFNFGTL